MVDALVAQAVVVDCCVVLEVETPLAVLQKSIFENPIFFMLCLYLYSYLLCKISDVITKYTAGAYDKIRYN